MNVKVILLVSAALAGAVGCASSGYTDGPRPDPDVITAEEIEATEASNLYELVHRLRPRWLDVRTSRSYSAPTEIVVYQGQAFLGGIDILRELGKGAAHRLVYLDASTASATLPGLGSRQVEGAIVINPRR